ncbi:RICIN domain-containing protein [Phytohabitans suffuscus]|uniref:Uncharacterized protein n=1 Tax=Phytohabitans suffuscus TaxID=624315 RepID=A0A6F8YC29_9ACTN|nr:ricin-type beta-trefoil lectin domain protein [Phytohabitans suffuscus]BCB83511.1 hypothetical protein Psuf_008240 [Phytohabitans suffuscus]
MAVRRLALLAAALLTAVPSSAAPAAAAPPGANFRLVSVYASQHRGIDMCLNVGGNHLSKGSPFILWPCGSPIANDQFWISGSENAVTIISVYATDNTGSPQCANIGGDHFSNGSPIILWPCGAPPDDQWVITDLADGDGVFFRAKRILSRALNVGGTDHMSNNSPIVLWDSPSVLDNDVWLLKPV